jgi:hypothetical protein
MVPSSRQPEGSWPLVLDQLTFRLNDGKVKPHTLKRLDSFATATGGRHITYREFGMIEGLDALEVISSTVLAYRREPIEVPSQAGSTNIPGLTFYEFFAGGGMARAGLSGHWKCLFANDFDFKKSATYEENWGKKSILTKDVAKVQANEIPGHAGLAWASFPCQDLSLAGMGAGLRGNRSGTFWPFWNLMTGLIDKGRA